MLLNKVWIGAKNRTIVGVAAVLIVSGCVSVTIDERVAFQPQKNSFATATTVTELNANMALRFRGGVDEGIWQLTPEPQGGTRLTFREDTAVKHQRTFIPAPMVFTNGFIGEGTGRVAWTFYWEVSLEGSQTIPTRPLVVHCAGNAGDRYNSGPDYAGTALRWADVLVFDYPGYGDTPGPASAAKFEAASALLIDHITVLSQNRKLVFWGHSLGGFVCSRLAATMPGTDGLILETTAPNAEAVARAWTPNLVRPFVRPRIAPSLAKYDVVAAAAQMTGPILVLGATKDQVLPVALARQVADGLASRKMNVTYQEFPRAHHTNVPYQRGFKEVVSAFFKTIESQP